MKVSEDGKTSPEFLDILYSFANEDDKEKDTAINRRPVCSRCCRPVAVCLCPYLPESPVSIETNVFILQHPLEESRNLATVPILCECLPSEKVQIIKGKKFSPRRYPKVAEILRSSNTLLLFPDSEAADIEAIPPAPDGQPYNLVLLDGTWGQAKGMFLHNEVFSWPKKIKLNHSCKSKFVIRTQPNDMSLSTLESTAIALAALERKPDIVNILTRPLEALCDFQIQHGACKHDSKVFKIENGLWNKTLKKKYLKKLEQDGTLGSSQIPNSKEQPS
ncbi:tRNA-uridine aminocarboxypropyltransferase 2-like [Saccostrea echinata]|uniref:tRNA-uridine aminocarboxypropyltransferase 2-like n=1 Tax=Saccostrea echinata TaxID=191078 RepID=UPI002A80A1D5|nr:tRNA-uridine aminocarboxypropyltransferase 2-like [Saccostrea echinata]